MLKSDAAVTTVGGVDNGGFDQLAVDDRSIYAVGLTNGIYRFDKSGGQPVKLVTVDRQLVKFVIDAQNLFWSNYDQGDNCASPQVSRRESPNSERFGTPRIH